MLSTARGALWGWSCGVQGCEGQGSEGQGLPLAGRAGAGAVLSQTWGCLTCLH